MKYSLTFILSFSLILVTKSAFPNDIEKCRYGDSKCISNIVNTIVANYAFNGHRGLNFVPVDPLQVREISLDQNRNSPVNIELKFNDVTMKGFSKFVVTQVNGFQKDPKVSPFDFQIQIPSLTIEGPYTINGRVLILPIVGDGIGHVVFENVNTPVKFITKVEERSGRKYLKIMNCKIDLKVSQLKIHFGNLFNGNKELGDNMNKFMNENWSEIFGELKPAIEKAISGIITPILNGVFSKFPYDELFLD